MTGIFRKEMEEMGSKVEGSKRSFEGAFEWGGPKQQFQHIEFKIK